jgi:ABC-type uncharacterized transport system involved in gliding motility auxiliary subunit
MAGVLEKREEAKAEITPLIKTTPQGDELKVKPGFGEGKELAYTDLNSPTKFLDRYSPTGEKILSFMIHGQMDSVYPEGTSFPKETPQAPPGMPPGFKMPVPEDAEMITKEAIPAERFQETRIIVFSDVDFISDPIAFQQSLFGVQAVNDNHKILLNCADYLLGSEELMAVRAKQSIRRPFEVFDQIEAEADRRTREHERNIRNEIERFQAEVREKQQGMNQKDAVLFEKKLADEVANLNEQIRSREKELREIKKQKRATLESRESFVSFTIVGLMPLLICIFGLANMVGNIRARKSWKTKE